MRVHPLLIKYLAMRRRTLLLSMSYMVKKIILVVGLLVSFAMPNRHEIRLSSEGSSSRSWSMWRVGLGESCTPA